MTLQKRLVLLAFDKNWGFVVSGGYGWRQHSFTNWRVGLKIKQKIWLQSFIQSQLWHWCSSALLYNEPANHLPYFVCSLFSGLMPTNKFALLHGKCAKNINWPDQQENTTVHFVLRLMSINTSIEIRVSMLQSKRDGTLNSHLLLYSR